MSAAGMYAPDLLAGQVALVSGGGTGLGRATATALAGCGAHVVICGRRQEPLDETVALIGERCEAHVCDIREEDQVAALVDGVLAQHGRIDVLINNAGGQFLTPAEDITPKGFRTVIRLNVEGTWLMTHAVATKAMIPAGRGRIISVTISPRSGMPGMVHSAAARAAVDTMTQTLATEWGRFGIRVNSIATGQFGTDTLLTKYPPSVVEATAGQVPLQRLGDPDEFAALVLYLTSPLADFMTGAVIPLDGARDNWRGEYPPAWMAAEERR
jgi:citronellol/citronellal dehydrogenase